LQEAVDCYRVGAYRASVITTWIAVAYDLVDKLRELAISGEKKAEKWISNHDANQQKRDTEALLKAERELLDTVHDDFELISAHELSDLKRLFEDRNRCGHPNFNRENDAYVPSAELARLHLRTAVEHVLEKPPVQGKAALQLIFQTVESQYFPTKLSEARQVLVGTALPRARAQVARDFIFRALLSMMREKLDDHVLLQRLSAARAAAQIRPVESKQVLENRFDSDIFNTPEGNYLTVLWLLASWADLQDFVQEATWVKLRQYIRKVPKDEISSIAYAHAMNDLKEEAEAWITKAPDTRLASYVTIASFPAVELVLDRAVKLYADANSFDDAKFAARTLIRPLASKMTKEQAKIAIAAGENDQVSGSNTFVDTMRSIRTTGPLTPEEFRIEVTNLGLTKVLSSLFPKEEPFDEEDD
jgi:hypothetical protein